MWTIPIRLYASFCDAGAQSAGPSSLELVFLLLSHFSFPDDPDRNSYPIDFKIDIKFEFG